MALSVWGLGPFDGPLRYVLWPGHPEKFNYLVVNKVEVSAPHQIRSCLGSFAVKIYIFSTTHQPNLFSFDRAGRPRGPRWEQTEGEKAYQRGKGIRRGRIAG